jgi:hypothetical protein
MQLGFQLRTIVFTTALISLGLAGCSDDKGGTKPTPPSKVWDFFSAQATGLNVVGDDLQPLANARVLIGSELDAPFAGNYLTTDAQGHLDLPAGWTDAAPVTIEADEYLRATYYAQEPGDRTYRLRKKAITSTSQFEMKGLTQGHNIQDKDGFVDFSLVIPALTRNDFMSFDINSVISPQSDIISVLGQEAEVPSNVTFPKQKESYFLPVTLDKPGYRVYFNEAGFHRVFAARGRFPFKDVVDQMRAKAPFYNLVNYFTIQGGGVKDLNLTRSSTSVDLSVKDLDFKSKVSVQAPSIGGDETMMVVGVAHMAEYMIPTDVKMLKSGQKMSISALDSKGSVFSILKKTADMESISNGSGRLSAVLVPAGAGVAPKFLPMLQDPTLASNGDLLVAKTNSISGVNPIATYAILSQVQETKQGSQKIKINSSYWEVYAPKWIEVVSLPKWPAGNPVAGKMHWEVNLIGSLSVSDVDLGPSMINNATHVTHSSLDF